MRWPWSEDQATTTMAMTAISAAALSRNTIALSS
jgi:hypothetical protein